MQKALIKKIIGGFSVALLFLNLVFLGIGKYSEFTFWIVLGVIAVCAFVSLRLLK